MSSRTQATAELRADGQPDAILLGPGSSDGKTAAVVEGSPQRIAGWLTGRVQGSGARAGLAVTGELANLPRWL